jgi:hypothetical protein
VTHHEFLGQRGTGFSPSSPRRLSTPVRPPVLGIVLSFDLTAHVAAIDANRTVKDALLARLKETRPRRRISVTDLTNPRKAFMQRTHPEVQPTLERKQVMMAGTGFHELFGHTVSREEYLEQLVEWEGVVGKIDIYKDVPTELKTTHGLDEDTDPRLARASYVEQLAMYCALADRPRGRLVIYDRGGEATPPSLIVQDAEFPDLPAIRAEIARRRDLVAGALERGDPAGLPRCPWSGRGCEFEAVCGCAAVPERFEPTLAWKAPEFTANPGLAAHLLGLLPRRPPPGRPRVHHLIYPRRAYYDALRPREESGEERLGDLDRRGWYEGLREALRFGEGSESTKRPVLLGELSDLITEFRGAPTLLRTAKLYNLPDRRRIPELFSNHVLRLAFDCALAGTDHGRLILFYERLRDEDTRLQVYDLTFRDMAGIRGELEGRLGDLGQVREGAIPPDTLPACPTWMAKNCPHQPECACPAGAPG